MDKSILVKHEKVFCNGRLEKETYVIYRNQKKYQSYLATFSVTEFRELKDVINNTVVENEK